MNRLAKVKIHLGKSFLPSLRCSFFDQRCNLLRPGDIDHMAGAWDFDRVAAGSFGISPFEVGMMFGLFPLPTSSSVCFSTQAW